MNFYTLTFKQYPTKKFINYIIIIVLCSINIIAAINFYIDPLRMFSHKHFLNEKQVDFNERQQKTNYLKFVNNNYDSVMLGSSRSTYINQYNFENMKLYNYAANGMSPYEYKKFLSYFTKLIKKEPKYIILGIDFFGTSKEKNIKYTKDDFLTKTQNAFYRFKNLYSLKLLEYSIKNIRQKYNTNKPYYSRNNIKKEPKTYKIKNKSDIEKHIIKYKNYMYDKNYKIYMQSLKDKYTNSKFIIFTTPVTINQLVDYKNKGYIKYYFLWLKDLIDIFGEIDHFMYPNEVTKDISYFFDATHMYPKTGTLIADFITKNIRYKNFGIKLDNSNIDHFIKNYNLE